MADPHPLPLLGDIEASPPFPPWVPLGTPSFPSNSRRCASRRVLSRPGAMVGRAAIFCHVCLF